MVLPTPAQVWHSTNRPKTKHQGTFTWLFDFFQTHLPLLKEKYRRYQLLLTVVHFHIKNLRTEMHFFQIKIKKYNLMQSNYK